MANNLSDNEQSLILNVFNKIDVAYPKNLTVVDLFLTQVGKTPDKLAVVYGNNTCTYKELDILSNQLANYLITKHHIVTGDLIGIMIPRSEMLIVCVIGILKSKAAYVPIDSEYPQERINYIKNDCKCKLNLDASILKNFLATKGEYSASLMTALPLKPNDLAYIIYTSGSTGNPKGVMIEHRNLLNYLLSVSDYIDEKSNNSGCYAHLSLSFDASITEIFLPIIFGKKLILSTGTGVEIFEDNNLFKYAPYDFIKLTPSHINLLTSIIDKEVNTKLSDKYIIGGEALFNYHINLFKTSGIDAFIVNEYGPTEATVGCCSYEFNTFDSVLTNENIPIGKPISNTKIYILDKNQQLLPIDQVGEIYISGQGIARGYINRKDLNLEKFSDDPFNIGIRMYRTGDLGKWTSDGNLLYEGRFDEQVKINGHRIELGEIEATLMAIPEIKLATVLLSNHFVNEPCLVAYMQPQKIGIVPTTIREELSKTLPSFMIPRFFMWIDDFPITTNGKIDKKNLPKPEYIRPHSAPLLRKPRTKIEKQIAKIWSEQLQTPIIGIDDNFFEMGGTSLLTQRLVILLRKHLDLKVSITNIYQYPTIFKLSEFLEVTKKVNLYDFSKIKIDRKVRDVAIIGMAGRFPGAQTINELWEVLKEGKETISFFKREEIDTFIPESLRNDPLYVPARGIIPNANTFDAAFFGINPKLAEVMDPQQRLFLEICWETLEQSGYLPNHYSGSIGVYAGMGTNTYYKKNILPNQEIVDSIGYLLAETVNEKDYISSRVAYHLNLKGPAVSIHSGCSTSLLAIAQATEAIRSGQCDIALAGGSSVTAPIFSGHLYQEGSMLSSDGHCRSFDADAKGTVFSDGAGVVLLKSLEAARKDGDKIYGLIKGLGVTNDGGNKGSFTAPSTEGQAVAIMKAIQDAQIKPDSISYVETHGTATPMGDPIEFEGLKIAFGDQPSSAFCAIGSIKSNMGHLTAAAGVAGLIKTVLAMNNKLLPPSLGFDKPNPVIDFENSPFFVNSKLSKWDSDKPLRAGVSSFGVGGTNVHLVVEEYPIEQKKSGPSRPLQLLMWSAKSENSLKGYETELGNFLKAKPDLPIANVAYSLNKTRDSFIHRSFILAENSLDASQELLSSTKKTTKKTTLKIAADELIYLFPGQGSQFSQMGLNLYKSETVYKQAVDKCAGILLDKLKLDIRDIIYPEIVTTETEAKLRDTRLTQPALFVTEYALSQLWLSWGIKPTALCGHSIGEFVAAHLAGVINLDDALHLIAIRGRLVSELPGGSMLSVRLTEDKLKDILPETLSIAAVNSKFLCVVAGEDIDVKEFSQTLDVLEVANKLLFTSHAFHSSMMDPVVAIFEAEVKKVQLSNPNIPIISTVTGQLLKNDEAIDPKYWSNHLRNTVRFANAADTLLTLENPIFLEVGPGQTLTSLVKQQSTGKITPAFVSLTMPKYQENEYNTILNSLGELWLNGITPDWSAFYSEQERQKIELPSYVFDRKLCWIDPPNFQIQNIIPQLIKTQNLISNVSEDKPIRKNTILSKISSIVSHTSGIEYSNDDASLSFLDLGLDSLTLTQLANRLKKEFKLSITFRQLNEEFGSPSLLADYLDQNLVKEEYGNTVSTQTVSNTNVIDAASANIVLPNLNGQSNLTLELIEQQLQLLGKQMELLLQANNILQTSKVTKEEFNLPGSEIKMQKTLEDLNKVEEITAYQKTLEPSTIKNKSDENNDRADNNPPVDGAKLGRDKEGNPAWFVADPNNIGEYIKINL